MSSNEIRQTIGIKPSTDPQADELRNANISQPTEEVEKDIIEKYKAQKANGEIDDEEYVKNQEGE